MLKHTSKETDSQEEEGEISDAAFISFLVTAFNWNASIINVFSSPCVSHIES